MPWKQLSSWSAASRRSTDEAPTPLTLVTLSGTVGASADEVAFYADAELAALMAWAASGRFVMAFVALEREELTLVCPASVEATIKQISELPLIAAGLATADVRLISSLRLNARDRSAH